jgi:predicted flap endonuclease-1-like 5' DNA nuclease
MAVDWLSLFIGILIGWLAEWLIDLFYWRRQRGQVQQTGQIANPQTTGSVLEDDRSVSRRLRDAEILFQDCWRTLEERTAENERLKVQLAALQAERRNQPVAQGPGAPTTAASAVAVARSQASANAPAAAGIESAEIAADGGLKGVAVAEAEPATASMPPVAGTDPTLAPLQAAAAAVTAMAPDDLELIEGIGPKIATLLKQNGITSFVQLADCDVADLRRILDQGGRRFQVANPGTWPQQARLIATGQWDALKELQDRLASGVER